MHIFNNKGQNAIEYLLLLALVVGIVLVAFRTELPSVVQSAENYYNRAAERIVGDPPLCGDRICDPLEIESECSIDCVIP